VELTGNESFDGKALKGALEAAQNHVERHIDELNMLNVFPVPDGDTGINMFVTLRSANEAIAAMPDGSAAAIATTMARGALLGASGNSGVILSQILRGIAKGLEGHDSFDTTVFTRALQMASENAYRAVGTPVEGTILTVSRDAAKAAQERLLSGATMAELMNSVVKEAQESVKRTPDLLPQLKDAGVVDAGAKGFFYFLQGISNSLSSTRATRAAPVKAKHERSVIEQAEGSLTYGFDLQFLISGRNLTVAELRTKIETMGESVLVVGDEETVRVHIHTTHPQDVLDYAAGHGKVTDVINQNMDEQVEEFSRDLIANQARLKSSETPSKPKRRKTK
jgi:DAK2 domain fusion protein YloV